MFTHINVKSVNIKKILVFVHRVRNVEGEKALFTLYWMERISGPCLQTISFFLKNNIFLGLHEGINPNIVDYNKNFCNTNTFEISSELIIRWSGQNFVAIRL